MANKHWIAAVLQSLEQSLAPVPHEVNELDWKATLSDNKDRLAEHLMAFANYPNGGSLVFGVEDSGQVVGIDQAAVALIANTLSNLGRDAVEPPLALDHAVRTGQVKKGETLLLEGVGGGFTWGAVLLKL